MAAGRAAPRGLLLTGRAEALTALVKRALPEAEQATAEEKTAGRVISIATRMPRRSATA